MKAYVIKNKDGYYIVNTFMYSKKLIHAYIAENEKDLKIILKDREDCTIVPITISEGDLEEEFKHAEEVLEQQLAEKDKEITMLKSQNQFFMEETKRLDQEIEELKKDLKSQKGLTDLYSTIAGTNATKMSIEKATRHQICNEAKKRIVKETCYDTEEEVRNAIYDFNAREVLEILDQIEKGE